MPKRMRSSSRWASKTKSHVKGKYNLQPGSVSLNPPEIIPFVIQFRRFDDLTIYPIRLTIEELDWRLSVGIDLNQNCFTLSVNSVPFAELP